MKEIKTYIIEMKEIKTYIIEKLKVTTKHNSTLFTLFPKSKEE